MQFNLSVNRSGRFLQYHCFWAAGAITASLHEYEASCKCVTLSSTLYTETSQLIGCFYDNVIISQSTKYIHLLCSLYLMTEDDQMNSGSCMLSLTVCLILLLLCLISVCWYWLPLVCQDGGLLPGSSQLLCYSWSFCQIHRPGRARGAGLHQKPTEWVLLWWHLLK